MIAGPAWNQAMSACGRSRADSATVIAVTATPQIGIFFRGNASGLQCLEQRYQPGMTV